MSLKYRDSQGNETPVAGLNGTSGELVPSVAAVRKGTFTVPPKPENSISIDILITFDTPMKDADYEVVFSTNPTWPEVILIPGDKTANGFEAHIAYPINVPVSYTMNYTAFKLMTDEVHEADSAHIAQNTANFAPAFSDSVSYAVGDYVTYNNILYRCTTAHTAGVWVAGHFTQVTVGGTLGDIVPSDASASNKLVTASDLNPVAITTPTPASGVTLSGATCYGFKSGEVVTLVLNNLILSSAIAENNPIASGLPTPAGGRNVYFNAYEYNAKIIQPMSIIGTALCAGAGGVVSGRYWGTVTYTAG